MPKKKKVNPKKIPGLGKDERDWELPVQTHKRALGRRKVQEVPTKEVINVMADTFERLDFFAGNAQRVNCEDRALRIYRGILFNFDADNRVSTSEPLVSVRERDFGDPPLCKEHRA